MAIEFTCVCGTRVEVAEDEMGDVVACPNCKAKQRVPSAELRIFGPKGDPEAADLFMPAPSEIGPLHSAHTSLLRTTKPKPFWLRLLIGVVLAGGLGLLVAVACLAGLKLPLDACLVLFVFCSLVIIPFTVGLSLYFTRFRHYCGYVGTEGIAHFACAGSPERLKARETFLFQDADDLRVATTHHYHNGAYNGTTYRLTWTDSAGKRVFVLSGTHNSEHKPTPIHDKYRFALAAEEAWSDYLLTKVLPEIRAGNAYTFRLTGQDQIRFRLDSLELHMTRRVQHFAPDELTEVSVKEGTIALKEPGAKEGWFTSSGVHYFSFADLANAQVFLLLLERLYGVPLGS